MERTNDLLAIVRAGIDAVRPANLFGALFLTPHAIPPLADWLSHPASQRFLLCMGKAALSSAETVLRHAPCADAFALAPYYRGIALPGDRVHAEFGSHPLPDQRSIQATGRLLDWLGRLPSHARLLVVLSGGSSALLFAPLQGVSDTSKTITNDLLIRCGASIHQINTVRKHLSRVKGGRLAGFLRQSATALVLLISDVIGDDPATIGSGPFHHDPTTFLQAEGILQEHALWDKVPEDVRQAIRKGVAGDLPETPKPGSITVPHFVIGSNAKAREAAAQKARELGFRVTMPEGEMSGSVERAADDMLRLLREQPPRTAMILGGEVTVRVTSGAGIGGRNLHLALLMTERLDGTPLLFAAAGTDGIDGNSQVAGAWTDGITLKAAAQKGLSCRDFLQAFDAFHFFDPLAHCLRTGPTGTNVMDLYVGLTPD
jgi:glycerate 2-kinase